MADNTQISERPSKNSKQHQYPIANAINRLIHSVRDTSTAAKMFIPLATQIRKKQMQDLKSDLEKAKSTLHNNEANATNLSSQEIYKTYKVVRSVERLLKSRLPQTLEKSLFLGIFSAFDTFTGDLLTAIYTKKPELFNSMGETISVAEIVKHSSFDEIKQIILNEKIENFRRMSYVEQFKELEKTFDIKLRDFPNWSNFVECGQRRNILTHGDGVVSDQYIKVCKGEGYNIPSDIQPGVQIRLGAKYFYDSCDLIIEVAVKLGQTLWRKIIPEELQEAESQLSHVIYSSLERERWNLTLLLTEFAFNQKKIAKELNRRIAIINHAIGLKFGGQPEKVGPFLSKYDWSASINDLKLGEAVLLEKYEEAADVMRKIGKEGELVTRTSYHVWPLFKDFRGTDQFISAYQEVYGEPFIQALREATDIAEQKLNTDLKSDQGHGVDENSEQPIESTG